ncbi:MAG: class I tRNA ligase family protein, partial [Eggerthellaceae bacterium]|nr:class I tRNA ligase family protein [Eggerthellaceae bacterium]
MGYESDISWPKRAVVTAGMPYGNKTLHFGHIGGVFVPADCYARFLKDRIGHDNVLFVSGTDCYGSPIMEGYRKLKEAKAFDGSISDYVMKNHLAQASTLKAFEVDLSIFDGSGIGRAGEIHQQVTDAVLERLHESGTLKKMSTLQFYDTQAQCFLNGRQVVGHCPVQGCKSEKAYADECDLGHQYSPEDLLAPVSSVTGSVPEMRPVDNWYFELPAYLEYLQKMVKKMEADQTIRTIVPQAVGEFLVKPIAYIKNEAYDAYREIADKLPKHIYRETS